MHKSEHRLLTTHAGSLPRPASLTRLYARRSRGEAVQTAELEVEGKAALRHVVAKQIEAGIDVANNGEQQRDSFVLYVRDRLLGGTWQRRQRADVERYPAFKQKAFGAVDPFHLIMFIVLAMVIAWPELSLWLPAKMSQ